MNKKIDKILLISVITTAIFGIIMIYSASNIWAGYKFNDPLKYVKHQSFFFILSLISMFILSKIDYKIYYGDSLDNIITSKEIFQDEDGMYFYKFKTNSKNFTHGVARKDSYKLVLNFPLTYKDYKYQGLMEGMTIYINSRQV